MLLVFAAFIRLRTWRTVRFTWGKALILRSAENNILNVALNVKWGLWLVPDYMRQCLLKEFEILVFKFLRYVQRKILMRVKNFGLRIIKVTK
jgi:hypothetical protein